MRFKKLRYVFGAFPKRFIQPRICPSCGTRTSSRVDRKGFHELRRCTQCSLLYRWPTESAAEMETFYQRQYKQIGLTTDLPDNAMLATLLETAFKGSSKDFSRVINLFKSLNIETGSRILDFGANWGYGVWQFRQAGYDATGYEISKPRAEFAQRLCVTVHTDWKDVIAAGPFDVAFSSHVLEHTPDPVQAIRDQLAVLKPNGLFIAVFPNGSDAFRLTNPNAFHKLWGQIHPVMLNDEFIAHILKEYFIFQGNLSDKDVAMVEHWNQQVDDRGDIATSELLVVAQMKDSETPQHTVTAKE